MSNPLDSSELSNRGPVYHIRVKGHLGTQWSDWFGGLDIVQEKNGETLLSGPVVDQAYLHGILRKVRDLGLPLISVHKAGKDDNGTA